jgi:DNA-binding response OmpR family regulator
VVDTTLHTEKTYSEIGNDFKVILAEDDTDDALIFELAIKELNLKVDLNFVNNGEKLLDILRHYLPDIIFLDIEMPCKNGIACIVEIRKNRALDTVPVIMISSHTNHKYIDDSYLNGANYYLIKGNSVKQLSENLKKIFIIDWRNLPYNSTKDKFVINNIKGAA